MRKRSLTFVFLSALTALVSYFGAYTSGIKLGDSPQWLTTWLLEHKSALPLTILVLSLVTLLGETWRAYVEHRHPAKGALVRLLNDFANSQFGNHVKRNRLTIFRATQGWRHVLNGTLRLLWPISFEHGHKWRALFRLHLQTTYLTVYMRPPGTRNVHSTTALRVSDTTRKCEGVAGLIWDNGSAMLSDLPLLNVDEVRAVSDFSDLPANHDIRVYARETNLESPEGLLIMKSMEHFARHFMGYTIKTNDGKPWGVLLLDSEDEACPFAKNKTGGELGKWMVDRAQLFGSLLT